ncbi:MAG: Ig-like domain-containing protein, partial [Mucilaginibacter sp.]
MIADVKPYYFNKLYILKSLICGALFSLLFSTAKATISYNYLKKFLVIAVALTVLMFSDVKAQTVSITSPATGSTYTIGNTITVTGTASAPLLNFVSSVVVTVSTATVTATGTTSYSASVSTTGLSPGTYILTVTNNYSLLATGLFSGSKSTTISVTLIPPPPIIAYTTPQVYTVGTAITTLTPTNTGGAVGTFGFGTATALTGATLNNPRGVGIDASGNVYVTNSGNNTISKYNSSGTYVSTFGSGATMSFPKDIVFDSAGNAYVLNLGASAGTGSVYKYNSSGVYQS